MLSDLIVRELVPWLLAVGEDLPQHHAEAPHVTLCGEPPVHDALRGHPADGQHRMTAHLHKKRHNSIHEKPTLQDLLKSSKLLNMLTLLLFTVVIIMGDCQ